MTRISAESAEPGAPPPPPVATRHFLLLFDLANSSPGTIGRASEAAKQFVDTQLGERDLGAVAIFTAESGAKMITGFTRNRTLLANAIETLGHPKYFKVTDPLMISAAMAGKEGGGQGGTGEGREKAIAEMVAETNRAAANLHSTEMKNRLKIQLQNMGMVARTLDRLKGQKQIILLSEGFDSRLVTGRDELSFEKTREENDATLSGEIWNVDSEKRYGNTAAGTDISQMADLFKRSDVVLHALDIKGLRTNVDASAGVQRSSNESLSLLTRPTGGTVFKNTNELSSNFGRMLKQQEVVYLLGFNARSTGKPGKFHELRVKSKAGRVSHRAGYYETGGKVSELEKTLSLGEVLMTDAAVNDVGLTVAATPLPGPGGKARVPVVVEIPGDRLLEGISSDKANANLYLYAFDEKNQVVDFMQQSISLDLAQVGDRVRGSGVRYFGTLRLPPGKYAVKALTRVEQTGRTGFFRSDLTVPAFDSAVVLPPLLFVEPENWIMLTGSTRGDDYAYPFSTGEAKFIPRRSGSLTPSADHKLALFLYRVPLENLEVIPEVVTNGSATATDKVKLLGRTAADDRGGVKLLFNFKPEGIPAGAHELRFTVKSKDGNSSVVTIPFRVL
ncbi:MAG TPA: VWA domain-containing protein, partial [Thermoanaerobaculia bacterium]|nr:VWA domain-containing protein [Thermoanaerobaculia bacterium]